MLKHLASFVVVILLIIMVVGCGERKTKEELMTMAEQYEAEENFLTAIKTYQRVLKKYPDAEEAVQAKYKIALIYSNNLNDFEKSVETHKDLIDKYPESKYAAQSLFMIGFINANNLQDLETAKQYYEEFLEKYPDNELASSVKWELDNLGKDINDIDFLNQPGTAEERNVGN
ncbi:tetratricopeptide repeat protein [candidate division KSB1 bacterium]|nr:tetratricopeptide repeat protein [candidate division KSB1 bacterium]